MRITTKGRYGLRAILELASYEEGKTVSIRTIAEKEHLSPEFLEQLFFRLKKANLIRSTRGPGGGFSLNLPLSELTIERIFDAVGEEISLAPCVIRQDDDECSLEGTCVMKGFWEDATNHLREYLRSVSIDTILKTYGANVRI